MVCRICASDEINNTFFVTDKMFAGTEEFQYFECGKCGTLQIAGIPDDMSAFYPIDYYSLKSDQKKIAEQLIQKSRDYIFYYHFPKFLVQKLSVKIPNLALEAFLKIRPLKSAKVLDVGCGEGKFLKSIFGLGFKEVIGIEPFALVTQEKPFPIYRKKLSEIEGKFDVITFNHVFEHVEDPHETLQQCYIRLNNSGKIIIRVPVKDSAAYDAYGENWVQWDAPRHFHLLTKKAFQILAKENGFEIESYYNDSNKFQFTGSEKYKRGLRYQAPNSIFSTEEIRDFNRKAQNLNKTGKGDQVVVILKKL